jgi:hypothetical protein
MATFSREFLATLGRPQMTKGMMDLGAAIGGLPGKAEEKQKREKFNEIMDLANRAMTTNDPVNLGRARRQLQELGFTEEANKLTAAQMQAEKQQTATGLFQTALGQPTGLTPQQQAGAISKGMSPEQVLAASELGKATGDPARDRGRARLRALAMNTKFNPEDPKQLEGYLGIARATRLSEDEAMQILSTERGTAIDRLKASRTGAGSGKTTFFGGGKYKDNRNLEYRITEIRNPDGTLSDEYQPVGHQIPYAFSYEDPETGETIRNRLTEKGGAYGETAGERTGRYEEEQEIKKNVDITKAETIKESDNFSDLRSAAAKRLPEVESTLADVNDLLEIVDVIDQGGSLVPLMNNIERVLGTEETDPGKLRIIAKELLVGRIKSFGANPTEGERQYLEQLIPDLANAEGVNKAILERLKERLGRERAAIGYMFTEGADLDGYVNYVNALYSADTRPNAQPTGNVVVDFGDI